MNKKIIRNQMIKKLKKMDQTKYNQLSVLIKNRLIASSEFIDAKVIGITISRFPEVDTRPIIEAAWAQGKKVAVPKCIPQTRTMDFRVIKSFKELETVYSGLLEPIVTQTESILKEEIDLQIVPGVVFSNKGYRIGFGGGYYDRYMTSFQGEGLSLAFASQTGQIVPIEKHDIPIKKIVTENSIVWCVNNE